MASAPYRDDGHAGLATRPARPVVENRCVISKFKAYTWTGRGPSLRPRGRRSGRAAAPGGAAREIGREIAAVQLLQLRKQRPLRHRTPAARRHQRSRSLRARSGHDLGVLGREAAASSSSAASGRTPHRQRAGCARQLGIDPHGLHQRRRAGQIRPAPRHAVDESVDAGGIGCPGRYGTGIGPCYSTLGLTLGTARAATAPLVGKVLVQRAMLTPRLRDRVRVGCLRDRVVRAASGVEDLYRRSPAHAIATSAAEIESVSALARCALAARAPQAPAGRRNPVPGAR